MLNRRDLLASGLAAGAASLGGVRAADVSALADPARGEDDYRALVCVFLSGGMDGHDTLIPMDAGPHREWRRARAALTTAYDASGAPRRVDALHAVGTDADGAAYGLPPQMGRTASAVRAGRAAIVANMGPLQAPVTPRELASRSVPLPPGLLSHSDQRAYWRRLAPQDGSNTGWGGRLAARMGQGGPLDAIAGGRDEGFTMGEDGPGAILGALVPNRGFGLRPKLYGQEELAAEFLDHLGTVPPGGGILERDFARAQRGAADLTLTLIDMMSSTEAGFEIADGAKRDSLAFGLGIIARMIDLRERTGVRRQVFYVEQGGYDTHKDQAARLPALQAELDEGLARFAAWLGGAGLSDAVTVFTGSDFGRTLVPNGRGTDHGWANHQIVMGGAVRGGLHGAVPPPVTGHDLDGGRGRTIPTLSVEQTGVPMARWLGLRDADLPAVFPFAGRFDLDAVPLMRA